jgi:hypothetical protein
MSILEKLIAEDMAIKKAMGRLHRRQDKLSKRLQDHRGVVVVINGSAYRVNDDTYPKIEYVGDLSL